MNFFKPLFLGISLTLALPFAAYAQDQSNPSLNSAEKGTLATIAVIDKNEILMGVIAENKKANSDVMDFAKMMVEQHGSNLTQILEMAKAGSLSSNEAEKLSQEGKQDLMKLGALQGKEFENAYADAMVKGHTAALKLIDDKLMKTAKSEEMKNFLTSTRAAVEKHLDHAKKLQAALKS